MGKVAVYTRFSVGNTDSASQLCALRRRVRKQGDGTVDFADDGTTTSRPAFDEMMATARRRELAGVVVVNVGHIARSLRHLVELATELESLDVYLLISEQSIDTTTPTGKLILKALVAVADLEHVEVVERISQGTRRAKRRGVRFGRPPALDRNGRRRAQRLRMNGLTIRAIAKKLNVGVATIARTLAAE